MRVLMLLGLVGALAACDAQGPDGRTESPEPVLPVPTESPDPAQQGPYAVTATEYDFGAITVSDEQTGSSYSSDVHGYISVPTDAPGPFPVVLFQHGRHQTCETGLGQLPVPVGDDNCPDLAPIITPANSYRGYDYIASTLASHGYAVISIDANDINDNDGSASAGDAGAYARAELILAHLDAFRAINAAGGNGFDALLGKLNFHGVGVMGHSRGGEGVNKVVSVNAARSGADVPHEIAAVFALAPTDYNSQSVEGPAFATLLPYCDGDVENLMGAYAYDASRALSGGPRFQILAMGANHNYFNTIWTSDDWTIHGSATEPHCGENAPTNARDTPEGQRALGEFFIASFFRYFVGHEEAFGRYWSGYGLIPASACPNGAAPCEDRYHLSIQPAAAHRLVIDDTPQASALDHNALNGPVTLEGFSAVATCTATGADGGGCDVASPTFSTASMLELSWTSAATYRSELGGLDSRAYDTLSLRVGVSHGDAANADGQDISIVLSDTHGKEALVHASDFSLALFDPPGDAFASGGAEKTVLNAVRVPLAALAGIDRRSLASVELRFDQTEAGTVQITDLMLQTLIAD